MHDINQIQRWMQAVIMNLSGVRTGVASHEARQIIDVPPEEVEKVITRSRALTSLQRLEIYNNAYYSRLLECLREEFPVLLHALGQDAFDQFAIDYLQKYPSRSYTLNRLGSNLPRYFVEVRPSTPPSSEEQSQADSESGEVAWADWPDFLIDLVTLERTYSEVFDGPGVEGQQLLGIEQVQAIPPECWPEARLVPVCCLRLLVMRFPVHKYYTAVKKKKDPAYPAPSATFLAVTRRALVVRRYELSRLEYVLLNALIARQPVGQAIALAAAEAGEDDLETLAADLQTWFRNWTAEGFFRTIEMPSAATIEQ